MLPLVGVFSVPLSAPLRAEHHLALRQLLRELPLQLHDLRLLFARSAELKGKDRGLKERGSEGQCFMFFELKNLEGRRSENMINH